MAPTNAPWEELHSDPDDINSKLAVIVRERTGISKVRQFTHLPSIGGARKIGGANNSITNLTKGVVERIFFVKDSDGQFQLPPQPDPVHFNKQMRRFSEKLLVGTMSTTPWTRQQFVDSYRGRKWKNYDRAAASLNHTRLVRRDSHVKTFVKWEKHDLTAKPSFVPRVIQPRSTRYNVEVGRFLSKVEKPMMRAIDGVFGYPVVMSGYNSATTGKLFAEAWAGCSDPIGIGLDAKRFDQHVSATALTWEHERWLTWFTGEDRKRLRRLLRWQLVNTGKGRTRDGTIKYTTDGKRMSGDMNTSSGNKLIMCALMHAYLQDRGIKQHRLFNNGDDCMLIIERSYLKAFLHGLEDWFLSMGFSMQVEPHVNRLEEVEFCQTRPVFDGHAWRMVRNYPLAMDKDANCFISCVNGKNVRRWMSGVGKAGLALTGGIPIAQEQYQRYINQSAGYDTIDIDQDSGFHRMSVGMHEKYRDITPEARASFYAAFGITPDAQIIMENTLAAWTLHDVPKQRLEKGDMTRGPGWIATLCKCPELGPNRDSSRVPSLCCA
nr:RNA polymerase [Flumine tombus-like virus 1]